MTEQLTHTHTCAHTHTHTHPTFTSLVCSVHPLCLGTPFPTVVLSLGGHNEITQTRELKQWRFIFSQFWRLAVLDQGAGRRGFSRGRSPWLADSQLLPTSSLSSFSICVLISSYKDTSQTGLGPTLMTSFPLNHFFKGPISKDSHILRCWWV